LRRFARVFGFFRVRHELQTTNDEFPDIVLAYNPGCDRCWIPEQSRQTGRGLHKTAYRKLGQPSQPGSDPKNAACSDFHVNGLIKELAREKLSQP